MKSHQRKGYALLALVFVTSVSMAQLRPGTGEPQPGTSQPGTSRPGAGQPDISPDLDSHASSEPAGSIDDANLQREVHEQLAKQGELGNVHVRVKDGVVYLEGSVPTQDSRKAARKVAESVRGVRRVKEKLTVDPTSGAAQGNATAEQRGTAEQTPSTGNVWANPHASDDAEGEIQDALRANPGLSGVKAQVSDNSVILTGNVPSDREEEQALSTTQTHAAGRTIYNRMTIASAAAGGVGSYGGLAGTMTSQAGSGSNSGTATSGNVGAPVTGTAREQTNPAALPDIAPQIVTALRSEPTLAGNDIKVSTTADEIVLTGTVDSKQERRRAREIAESFAQERRVVDHIRVKEEGPGTK